MRLGCLIFVAGFVVAVAGLFAFQLAGDSPGWAAAPVFRVGGLVVVVVGAGVGLLGIIRMAARR